MRFPFISTTLLALSACTLPEKNNNSTFAPDTLITNNRVSLTPLSSDSGSYIGLIDKFHNNNTFYTDLYFVNNFNHESYDHVKSLGDSIVYQDEETKRIMIPVEKAGQYFKLVGLHQISIFNKDGKVVASGKLSHIEYVDDVIESKFVAVFVVDSPEITDYRYCIGNSREDFNSIKYSAVDNSELTERLIQQLHLNRGNLWKANHYKINNSDTLYSTLSVDTTALILENVNNKIRTLYKSKSSEEIWELVITSKEVNGRPVLLTTCILPESDLTWTSLLIFNGKEYEISREHIIKEE